MKRNFVYTIVGVDGVQLSRTKGISVLYNGLPIDDSNAELRGAAFNEATSNAECFMANGLDMLVEAELKDGKLEFSRVVEVGTENYFDNDK